MRKNIFCCVKLNLLYIFMLSLIILCAASPHTTAAAAQKGLLLCYNAIIPSLFPFFVFSKILIKSDFCDLIKKYLGFIIKPLFNVNASGAFAFIIGILSGYPSGAYVVCELFELKSITKNEAHRLLPFCNNSGPLFIIGAIGSVMLKSVKLGIFLYVVHISSALLVGMIFRFYKKNEKELPSFKNDKAPATFSLGKIFTESVSESVASVLLICGFIVLFSCIFSLMEPLFAHLVKNTTWLAFLKGIFEITLGISELSGYLINKNTLVMISALLGFGGFCVFFQVVGAIFKTGLSIKTYFIGKILHAVFSALISFFAIGENSFTAFSQNQSIIYKLPVFCLYLPAFIILLTFWSLTLKKRKLF